MAQYKGAASEAGRAMHLMKKREKQREQMEQMKQRIAEENIMKSNIDKKFSAHYDAVEAELKSSTVGLVTLNDMKAKQEALVKEREKQLAKKEQSKELQLKLEKLREKERKKEAKRKISSLSFTLEEEDEAGDEEEEVAVYEEELEREEITTKKRKLGKNPDVDTSFLPDRDREEEENRLREELRQEWEAKQEKIKSEEIEITFSYWDGSGHRRTVKVGSVDCALRSPGHCGPASLGAPWEGAFNPDLRTSPVLSCEWSLGILEGAEKRFWALVGVARGFRVPGQDFQATAFLRAPVQAAMFCPLPLTFPDVGARAAPVDEKGQHDAAVPAEGTGDPAQRLQRAQVSGRGTAHVHQGGLNHTPPSMTSLSPRHEGRVGRSLILTFTMMCGCSAMLLWRRMSHTQARWYCGAGTRRTSTSFPPVAGSPMTPRRSGTSTQSGERGGSSSSLCPLPPPGVSRHCAHPPAHPHFPCPWWCPLTAFFFHDK